MKISSPEVGIPETVLTTRGDVIRRSATIAERLALGAASLALVSDGADAVWGSVAASYGTYSGDDTVDRAIAHGLGVIPSAYLIITYTNAGFFVCLRGLNYIWGSIADSVLTITAQDVTNIHVGHAATPANSANASGSTYYWVAIR